MAEIHHQWDAKKLEFDSDFEKVIARTFPTGRKFDLYVSSPYAVWRDKMMFDAIIEYKMYREGRQDFHPIESLEEQLISLAGAKQIELTDKTYVALVNRGGLSSAKWQEVLKRPSSMTRRA